MKKSPYISVITNITPNHLDKHKDYQEYIDSKKNIMLFQDSNSLFVTNASNDITKEIAKETKGNLRTFSLNDNADISIKNGIIYYKDEEILKVSDIKLPGLYNVENFMAAIGALYGTVKTESIIKTAKSFGGVAHRVEFIRELDGVKYYNSSIDSSPNRTKNTLSVFENKVVMISGGKDKGIPYDEIGPVIAEKVKFLILIGKTADIIEAAVKKTGADIPTVHCETYEQVVKVASENAVEGDIVVLSPASTSFDMFKNFEERGKTFKKYVNEL